MALTPPEHWSRGFVWTTAAETVLASVDVAVAVGAHWEEGFYRDQDGRLVTTAAAGSYRDGFIRDAAGALVVSGGRSTPTLFPFA